MTLEIKGMEKLSAIDYPGRTCCIVFLAGCNFRCPYCHNPDLIERPDKLESMTEDEVIGFMESRRKWLDGVCVTGGEPCLHEGLEGFFRKVKEAGFLIKLDTNGTNPEMVERLLKEGLVDYIAMDIKAPPERYSEITRSDVDIEKVRKTAEVMMKSGVEYEFRTTVVPRLFGKDDMESIGKWLRGARRFFLQGFHGGKTLDKEFGKEAAFSEKELERIADVARKYFKEVGVRT
jgi:pyruvate formate lyase activating enzyme